MDDTSVPGTYSLLDQLLQKFRHLHFAVRLWNGTVCHSSPGKGSVFTLVIRNPRALRRLCLGGDQLSLGEAFIWGDFDIEGDIIAAFHLADEVVLEKWSILDKLRFLKAMILARSPDQSTREAHLSGSAHSYRRDKAAVRFHYDVGNDFYRLWLDERMVYSCGYFSDSRNDLDTAQLNKLDYLCRKLRLKRGDRLLDIGCGWGGLILHAAQNYGVVAHGITLSKPQAELATEVIARAGQADRCTVTVCDYRDLGPEPSYDKIVSVGMFEHVGRKRLAEYFRRVWQMLRPGGAFLNHGIASCLNEPLSKGPSFIDRYVFPDGELLPIADVLRTAESAGFEVRDLESLREHYALTLRHWVQRLEKAKEKACRLTDEITYRIWRIYMAGSAHGFETGKLNLYQALLCKTDGGDSGLPMTRRDWYL